MDSSKLFITALLLVTAILAPSVITLYDNGDTTTIAIDFNEEEKKETTEKDFLFSFDFIVLAPIIGRNTKINVFYIEKNSFFLKTIFLPPPEDIS